MILAQVWVPGHPKTKGSLTPKGGYVSDTPASKKWRALVANRIKTWRQAAGLTTPHDGPTAVTIHAWLEPTSINSRLVAERAGAVWPGAGDTDKLARNVLDAIAADAKSAAFNGGAITNDNLVTRLAINKWPALRDHGREPGMMITVESTDRDQDLWYEQQMWEAVRGWRSRGEV